MGLHHYQGNRNSHHLEAGKTAWLGRHLVQKCEYLCSDPSTRVKMGVACLGGSNIGSGQQVQLVGKLHVL